MTLDDFKIGEDDLDCILEALEFYGNALSDRASDEEPWDDDDEPSPEYLEFVEDWKRVERVEVKVLAAKDAPGS